MEKRKKIPTEIETEVLIRSKRRACFLIYNIFMRVIL